MLGEAKLGHLVFIPRSILKAWKSRIASAISSELYFRMDLPEGPHVRGIFSCTCCHDFAKSQFQPVFTQPLPSEPQALRESWRKKGLEMHPGSSQPSRGAGIPEPRFSH